MNKKLISSGFTLVEMLVIAPIALIVIAGLVAAMVAMTGNALVTNARSSTAYNIQDALSRIDQDARIAVNFLNSYTPLRAPQGDGGGTTPFTVGSGDLMMTQQATTQSPYNATRDVVYYRNKPYACDSASGVAANERLYLRVIYFVKDQTLWRRTIVAPSTLTLNTVNTVCSLPWQRDSCPLGSTLNGAPCDHYDERLLDNVSAFSTQYYTPGGALTGDQAAADTILVTIATSQTAAGTTIYQTSKLRSSRTNNVLNSTIPNR